MARPTDYSDKIIKKTKEYLEKWEALGEAIPTVASLAVYLDVSRDTIYDWCSQGEKKEFSDIIEILKAMQEKTLINGSLLGELNQAVSRLILSSKHDYREKTDVTTDGKQINVNLISFDDNDSTQSET